MSSNQKKDYDSDDLSEYKLRTRVFKMRRSVKTTKNSGLDLKSKLIVGKVNIVNPKNLRNEFYCSICDVLKHDSISYQSHMTSKGHLKNIGKDLTVEKSTLSQVRDRLNAGSSKQKNSKASTNKTDMATKKPRAKKQKKPEPESKPMSAEQKAMYEKMGFYNFCW